MSFNDQVIKRYGSSSQKRQLKAKQLRYECLEESEWRKLAIKGWEALKKESELGSRMYKPSDDMIIGVLGEECFDSYREYKDMQIKNPGYDFVHVANAMVQLNQGIINSMNKVASNSDYYLDGKKKMVKTASLSKRTLEASKVSAVMNKIAEVTDDMDVYKKALKFAITASKYDKVNINDIKSFLKDKKALQSLYKIVR